MGCSVVRRRDTQHRTRVIRTQLADRHSLGKGCEHKISAPCTCRRRYGLRNRPLLCRLSRSNLPNFDNLRVGPNLRHPYAMAFVGATLSAVTGYTLSSMRSPASTRVASPVAMAESTLCAFPWFQLHGTACCTGSKRYPTLTRTRALTSGQRQDAVRERCSRVALQVEGRRWWQRCL